MRVRRTRSGNRLQFILPHSKVSASGKLLFSAKPKPDESFFGYILRLTELNNYDHPNWILGLAGLPTLAAPKAAFVFGASSKSLKGLSQLAGVDVSQLVAMLCPMQPGRFFGDVRFFGQSVPQYLVRGKTPKICPSCLAEDPYSRRLWDLAIVTACARHCRLLIDSCPKCGRRLSWSRTRLATCACGRDWTQLARFRKVDDSELVVSNHVSRLCGLPPADLKHQLPEALSKLSLKGFAAALCFVAGQFSGVVDVSGKKQATALRNRELHRVVCRALPIFDDWPSKFHHFLESRRGQAENTTVQTGVSRDFLPYKSVLYGNHAQLEFGFLRDAFESYLTGIWSGGYVAVLTRTAKRGSKFISRREASRRLEVPGESIDAMLKCGLLPGSVRNLKRSRLVLIEAAGVTALQERLRDSLFRTDVEELLGLSTSVVLDLIGGGIITPIRGPSIDGCSNWQIERAGVSHILDKFSKSQMRDPSGKSRPWSFLRSTRRLQRAGVGQAELVKCVLAGRIQPCGHNAAPGLRGYRFDGNQIESMLVGIPQAWQR